MTLLITVLTQRTIYQSADYRLTDSATGKVISNTSTKLVTLQYVDWDGCVAYTGIGSWKQHDTSEFVVQCILLGALGLFSAFLLKMLGV